MKRSPIFPKDENANCNELGYDPQLDFSKFLEEARKQQAIDSKLQTPSTSPNAVAEEDRKSKKSWKNSLFFWRKFEKKSRGRGEVFTTETSSKKGSRVLLYPKRSAVSGPIPGNGGRVDHNARWAGRRRPRSGPLAGCFTPTRAEEEESEIPYMCLDHHNQPDNKVKAFGPIYLA